MRLELPHTSADVFSIKIYHPKGIINNEQSAELLTINIPDDSFLVIADAKDCGDRVVCSWGFDGIQWLTYKPEYHSPQRLAPRPRPNPKITVDSPTTSATMTQDEKAPVEVGLRPEKKSQDQAINVKKTSSRKLPQEEENESP